MQSKTKIYITMGDINGIGPEVTLKAILELYPHQSAIYTIIGAIEALEFYSEITGFNLEIEQGEPGNDPAKVYFIPIDLDESRSIRPGEVSSEVGKACIQYIRRALSLVENNDNAAMVTAPISKQAIWAADIAFPGHTELLANWFKINRYAMMLISNELKVGLITSHIPIREVSNLLSQDLITNRCMAIFCDLRDRFNIEEPRIALAALNPHGGENGLFGAEEDEIIKPAIEELKHLNVFVEGPFPSDTLFIPDKLKQYHVIIAMYHDQGMIPLKMQGFGKAVNYTAGLPIIRTSPDHGTAFDIAGKNIADPSSMIEAIKLAIKLVK